MTPEEKDLLLKDLCARLPYGVKFKWCGGGRIISDEPVTLDSSITHWMPLPKMPVLSKSGNTGKDLKGGKHE